MTRRPHKGQVQPLAREPADLRRHPGQQQNPAWDPRQTGPPVARPWDQEVDEFEPTINSSGPAPAYLGDDQQYGGEFPEFGNADAMFGQPQPAYDPNLGDPLQGQPTDLNAGAFGFPEEQQFPDEKGRPHWQNTGVVHEADVPGAPPTPNQAPPVTQAPQQPTAQQPTRAPQTPPGPAMGTPDPSREPFGGGLAPSSTNMNSQSRFQPDLSTRIFQNPFADPAAMDMLAPAGDEDLPTRAATGSLQIQPVPDKNPDAGQLVVFFSCHGGSGSTMLATNTAAVVGALGDPACIIDLDLQLGSVLTGLGIESQCPMSKVISDMDNYEWQMLAPLLARHHTGLCVLSQVGHIEELSALDPGKIGAFFRYLQNHFKYVVVDGLRDFNDHALAAMDVADKVVLVSTQDVSAVRGAGMRIDILKRLGFPGDKIHLLINRYDRKSKVTLERISDALGIPPSYTVPNDFRAVSSSLVRGMTLSEANPDAKVSRATTNVARALFDLPPVPKKKGFFSKLFGGGGKKKPKQQKSQ